MESFLNNKQCKQEYHGRDRNKLLTANAVNLIPNSLCAVTQPCEVGMEVHCIGCQQLVSVLFVAFLIHRHTSQSGWSGFGWTTS